MNLPEAIEQSQARGEDGRFVSATPPTDAPPPGPQSAATTDATPTPADVAPAGDAYDVVAQKMIAADKAAIPSRPAVAEDRPTPAAAPDAALPGQTTRDAEANPPSSPEKPQDDGLTPYAGSLSKAQHDLLKSVPGMLLPADEWRKLTPAEQVEHLQDVRAIRNQRNRQFNQTNPRGRQPQQPPAHDDRTTPETGQPPRAGGTGEGDGVSRPTTTAQPGQGLADVSGLSPEDQADLQAIASEYGAESSVYKAQQRQMVRNAQIEAALRSQDQQRQTDAQAKVRERQVRSFEDAQFEQLKAKYPQLSDPATRDELREAARDYYALRESQGRPVEDREALRFVTHNTLYPQTQAQQQQQQQASRHRSLTGTFDRATPPVNPAATRAAVSEDDVYANTASALKGAYASGIQPGERAREAARAQLAR